jgi:hypothetical protein
MPSAGFEPEPAIPAGEWLQTHALDRSATGIDILKILHNRYLIVGLETVLQKQYRFILSSYKKVCLNVERPSPNYPVRQWLKGSVWLSDLPGAQI